MSFSSTGESRQVSGLSQLNDCSCRRLSARMIANPDILLSFDKDDDDTLDFVLATANLRATAYGIANKTRFQVKGERLFQRTLNGGSLAQKWLGTSFRLSPQRTQLSPA